MRRLGARSAALALGLVLALGLGCATDEERFAEHRQRAQGYIEEGQLNEALIELRSALRIRPRSAEVNFRIAELLNALGRTEKARFYYGETRRLDASHLEARLAEALLLRFEDLDEARALVEELVERAPESPLGYIGRTHIALVESDTDKAIAAAEKAVELDPEHAEAQFQLGVAYQGRIREMQVGARERSDEPFERALEAFRRARELRQPAGRWATWLNEGAVLASWPGHSEEARAAFRQAVESAAEAGGPPQERRALANVIRYARRSGSRRVLHWALRRRVELGGAPVATWRNLARLEARRDGDPRAVLERMVEAHAADPEAHVALARHLRRAEGLEAAAAYLEARYDEGLEAPALLDERARLQLREGAREAAAETVARMERAHPDHARTRLARGRLALAEGRPRDAARGLGELVASVESAEGQELLARAQLELSRPEAALQAVSRAEELAPRFDPELARLRARIEHAGGDCAAAVRTLARLLQEGELPSAEDRLLQARCDYALGRDRRARARLRRLVSPSRPPLEAVIAYAHYEGERDPERARELLEGALERSQGNPRLLLELTGLLLRQGRAEEARERLDAVLEEAGGSPRPLLRVARARVELEQGRLEAAERDARRAFEEDPGARAAASTLAAVLQARGEAAAARDVLVEADREADLPAEARLQLARLHRELGERPEAIRQLERVLDARPDHSVAKNDLAWALAEGDEQLDRALELAQSARRELGDEPAVADTLGYVYLKRGLPAPAAEQLRTAIELAEARGSPSPGLHYRLGLALRELERPAEAERAFERALALDADFAQAAEARRALEEMRTARASAEEPS